MANETIADGQATEDEGHRIASEQQGRQTQKHKDRKVFSKKCREFHDPISVTAPMADYLNVAK